MINRHKMHADYKDDWETPEGVFLKINEAFGYRIVLDVAASNGNYKCDAFYTKEDDALNRDWIPGFGWLYWCNPPYSLKEEFLIKAHEQLATKNHQGLMLLPASLETKWFRQQVTYRGLRFMAWPHRIQFIEPRPKDAIIQIAEKKKRDSGNTGASVLVAFINPFTPLPHIGGEPWFSAK